MRRFQVYFVLILFLCFMMGFSLPVFAASNLEEGIKDLAQQISKNMDAGNKKKIAVVEFSDLDGKITAFGQFLAEELITQLFIISPGQFEVVERRQLMKVLNEQQLTMTGLLDAKAMESIGKILGIEAIVTGSVADLGNDIKVNARLIGVDTAKIFAVASASIPKVGTVKNLIEKKVTPTRIEVVRSSTQSTQIAKANMGGKDSAHIFQNNFVKITLKSIYKSGDKRSINAVFKVVNITKENIYMSFNYSRKSVMLDEKGATWRLYDNSGIIKRDEHQTADTIFTPNTINTIGMTYKPQEESDGLKFDIVLKFIGEVKGEHVVFPVQFSNIDLMK